MARLEDVQRRGRRSAARLLTYPMTELLALVNANPSEDPDTERTRRWWRAELAAHVANKVWEEGHHRALTLELKVPGDVSDRRDKFMRESEAQTAEFLLKWRALTQAAKHDEVTRLVEAHYARIRKDNERVMAGGPLPWEPRRKEQVTIREHFEATLGSLEPATSPPHDLHGTPSWQERARAHHAEKNSINDILQNWQADGRVKRLIAHHEIDRTIYLFSSDYEEFMALGYPLNLDLYEEGLRELYATGLLLDVRVCPACSHFFVRTHDRMRCCSAKCRQKIRPVVKRDRAEYARRLRVQKKEEAKRRRINKLNLVTIPALETQIKKLDARPYLTPREKKALRDAREELTTRRQQLQTLRDHDVRVTTRKTSR